MVAKFTSKSNRSLRLSFFPSVQNNYINYIEFGSERLTKDQDGALILICLPVLGKICYYFE